MDDGLKKTIRDLEESLLQPEIRSSAKELDALLDNDFKEFGSSGEAYPHSIYKCNLWIKSFSVFA